MPLDRDLRVELVIAGTGLNLTRSPYLKPASPPFMGFFDALEGPFAGGWIVNMHDPAAPVRAEAVCDGEVIGSGVANLYRGDVERAGLPTPRCGFRFLLERPLPELFGRDIYVRIAESDEVIAGSPRQISQNHNIVRFLTRAGGIPEPTLRRLGRQATHRTRGIGISIVMPVFDPPRKWLIEALQSVQAQWSGNWELICIDDGSREPHVREVLASFAAQRLPHPRHARPPSMAGSPRRSISGCAPPAATTSPSWTMTTSSSPTRSTSSPRRRRTPTPT